MEKDTINLVVFDGQPSKRYIDENGFLHVGFSPVSKEQVRRYPGQQIPRWRDLGLDPMKSYGVYCPAEELEKAADTFKGLPLLLDHYYESAENPQKDKRVGTLGTNIVFEEPYLMSELVVTDINAIRKIQDKSQRELSASYKFDPVIATGVFEGEPYDLVMSNIRGNHVALVGKGRAGPDVAVADSTNGFIFSGKGENMDKDVFEVIAKYVDEDTLNKIKAEFEGEKPEADTSNDSLEAVKADEKREEVAADSPNTEVKAGENDDKRALIREIAARDSLAGEAQKHIGEFPYESMTLDEAADYVAKKLGLEVDPKDALVAVKSYMHQRPVDYGKPLVAMDAAARVSQVDEYLK